MPTYTLKVDGQAQDLAQRKIVLDRLAVSWRSGRQLVFRQEVRHDQADFQPEQSVALEVDGAVVFSGVIKSVSHAGDPGAERIEYTADGLRALSRQITVVNTDGVPKLVWNAEPDDDDYDAARTDKTVGEMIKELIDGHASALQSLGVIQGTGYLQTDLDALTAVPSRVVLRERDFDRAIREVLGHQPDYVFQIHPVEQRYRFHRVSTLSATTITVGGSDKVLANLLTPDLRTRYTAVKIVGGEQITPAVLSVSDGGLTPEWDSDKEDDWTLGKALTPADTDSGTVTGYGSDTITDAAKSWQTDQWQGGRVVASDTQGSVSQTFTVLSNTATTLTIQGTLGITPDAYEVENGVSDHRYVYSRWRITDSAKRRIAQIIPGGQYAPVGWIIFQRTYKPVVCEKRAFSGGSGYFYRAAEFDWDAGRLVTASPLARGKLDQAGAASGPEDVLLIYAYRSANLAARHPASGHAGTAYSQFGLQREKVIYDEQFISADDQSRYETLAQSLHQALGDVVYAGRIPLAKLDWSLVHLGKRVHITGTDRYGSPVTTGWENIGALLIRATYRFAEGTTDLDLSTDAGDWSLPFAELRERLRTQDRLRELESQVRRLRRRVRQSPGSPPPDPEALHRGLEGVESLAIAGGEARTGDIAFDHSTGLEITNPFSQDPQTFYFQVVPSNADPSDIASGPGPGVGIPGHYDHLHRGLRSFSKSGGGQKFGDVTVSEGDNVTITANANDFEIAVPDVPDLSNDAPQDVAGEAYKGAGTDASRADHVHRGVTSVSEATDGTPHFGNIVLGAFTLDEALANWNKSVILAWDLGVLWFSSAAPVVQGGNINGIRDSLNPGEFFSWEP